MAILWDKTYVTAWPADGEERLCAAEKFRTRNMRAAQPPEMFSEFCLNCKKAALWPGGGVLRRKVMSRLEYFKFLRLVPLPAFFFALPALAQFEVAPDHFDSNAKNEGVRKSAAKNKAALARPAASPAVGHATAGAVAKGQEESARSSDARSAGSLNGRTNGARESTVDRSRVPGNKRGKERNVAKATSTMSQRQ